MSDSSFGSGPAQQQPWQSNNPSAGPQDVVIQLKGIVQQLTHLVAAITGRVTYGTFTLAAAASTTIPNASVEGNSVISPRATNAAAATLMGSNKALYVSAIVPQVSFTVSTASGANAAGTETFSYIINSPT